MDVVIWRVIELARSIYRFDKLKFLPLLNLLQQEYIF